MDLVAILAWILLGILIWYTLKPMYEHFSLKASDIWLNRLTGEFELFGLSWGLIFPNQVRIGGTPIVGMSPSTCPKSHPSLEGGLCYQRCRAGFNGAVTMCVAQSFGVGIGTVVGLEDCPAGWKEEGLICVEPIKCSGDAWRPVWDPNHWRCRGGNVRGRLNNGGKCPGPGGREYVDRVDGLCYKKCPKDFPVRIPGMPYLCYKGGPLTYDRGVGRIPHFLQFLGSTSYETNIL